MTALFDKIYKKGAGVGMGWELTLSYLMVLGGEEWKDLKNWGPTAARYPYSATIQMLYNVLLTKKQDFLGP